MRKTVAVALLALSAGTLAACGSAPPRASDFDACKAAYASQLAYYVRTGHQPPGGSTQPKACQALTAAQRKQAAGDVVFGGQ